MEVGSKKGAIEGRAGVGLSARTQAAGIVGACPRGAQVRVVLADVGSAESRLGSPFADLVWILLLAALGPRRPGIAREPGVGGWGWLGEAGGTLDPVPAWVRGCGAQVTTAPRRPYAALQPGEGAARTVLLQRPALAVLRGTVAAAGPNVVSG